MKIKQTPTFKRDFKKLKNKHYQMDKLKTVVEVIANHDKVILSTQYKDHALTGNWKGYRELHIESDWLLIYKIDYDEVVLVLTRTGSHDDLFK